MTHSLRVSALVSFLFLLHGTVCTLVAQSLSPILIGTSPSVASPNGFLTNRPDISALIADPDLNLVVFIHRGNHEMIPASYQTLRYGYSVDGGQSFFTEIGPISPDSENVLMPQALIWNPPGNTQASQARLIYAAGLHDLYEDPIGLYTGTASLSQVSPSWQANAEIYPAQPYPYFNTRLQSLTQRVPGEYWMARGASTVNNNCSLDDFQLLRGLYLPAQQRVDWDTAASLSLSASFPTNYNLTRGALHLAFSPDGTQGWLATVACPPGADSVLVPVFWHSTDGGQTWGAPAWVDLRQNAALMAQLQVSIPDSNGVMITGSGHPTLRNTFALTVDSLGVAHMLVQVMNHVHPASLSNIAQYDAAAWLLDLTPPGSALPTRILAPIHTPATGQTDSWDFQEATYQSYHPQVSRSRTGGHVFFAWTDSDYDPSSRENKVPNLKIQGLRLRDQMQTCTFDMTRQDSAWAGKAYYPMMSEIMLTRPGSGGLTEYHFPLSMLLMTHQSPGFFASHYYFGNDVFLTEGDFQYSTAQMPLYQTCSRVLVSRSEAEPVRANLYPHPVTGTATFELLQYTGAPFTLRILDMQGRELRTLRGDDEGKVHLDRTGLPAGLYLYEAVSGGERLAGGKMVVN